MEQRTNLLPARGILQVTSSLADPAAHLHDRDFNSDRAGRKDDHAALHGGRRGATAHHGVGGETRPRAHEAVLFAHRIAAFKFLINDPTKYVALLLLDITFTCSS